MGRPKKYPDWYKFFRRCPECNGVIEYSVSSQYYQAIRKNRKCQKCGCGWAKGKTKNDCDSLKKMANKVSDSMKVYYKDNDVWNKGLTKDDHKSLEVIGNKRKGAKHSEEVKKRIGQKSKENWKNKEYREKVTEAVRSIKIENMENWLSVMEDRGHFTPIDEKDDWSAYKQKVWYHTRKNDLTSLDGCEKRGRGCDYKSYHLDHIYSITDGYNNNIKPEIIGSIYNLRFIPSIENQKKYNKSEIEIEKLKELYYGNSES